MYKNRQNAKPYHIVPHLDRRTKWILKKSICRNTRKGRQYATPDKTDANFDDFFKYKKKIEYAMTNRLNSKNIDRDKTFSK